MYRVWGSAHLNILVGHPDVVGISVQVFRRGHDGELYGPLIAKGLVGPFPDGPDLLDGSDPIVCDQYLHSRCQ